MSRLWLLWEIASFLWVLYRILWMAPWKRSPFVCHFYLTFLNFLIYILDVLWWLALFLRPERKDIILVHRIIQIGRRWRRSFLWRKWFFTVSSNRGIACWRGETVFKGHHRLRVLCLVSKGLLFERISSFLIRFDSWTRNIDHFLLFSCFLLKIVDCQIAFSLSFCKICSLCISITSTALYHSHQLPYFSLNCCLSFQ